MNGHLHRVIFRTRSYSQLRPRRFCQQDTGIAAGLRGRQGPYPYSHRHGQQLPYRRPESNRREYRAAKAAGSSARTGSRRGIPIAARATAKGRRPGAMADMAGARLAQRRKAACWTTSKDDVSASGSARTRRPTKPRGGSDEKGGNCRKAAFTAAPRNRGCFSLHG